MPRKSSRKYVRSHRRRTHKTRSRHRSKLSKYKPRNKLNRGLRPSPAQSATLFSVGHVKRGQDGRSYVVKRTSRGIKRWVATR
jgi:hypothetical protein